MIDALTKVLVGLYEEPERPPNAVDYIKRYMGAPTGSALPIILYIQREKSTLLLLTLLMTGLGIDVEALRAECEALKQQNAALEATVTDLNAKLNV